MTERPENFPDQNHVLLKAARLNDAEADEDFAIQDMIAKRGLTVEAVHHIAEQRALRMVLHSSDRLDEVSQAETRVVHLSSEQKAQVEMLTPVYMDGIMLGWRACELNADTPDGGVTIGLSLEGAKSFASDSSGWGAIGYQEIEEAIVAALSARGIERPYRPDSP